MPGVVWNGSASNLAPPRDVMDLLDLPRLLAQTDADQHRWIAPYECYRERNIPRLNQGGFTHVDLAREETALLHHLRQQSSWRSIEGVVVQLCRAAWTMDAVKAVQVRAWIKPARGVRWALMDVANRCGAGESPEPAEERLALGVIALVLEDMTIDYRESLMCLADLHLAAEHATLDPMPWFHRAAPLAGSQMAQVLSEFADHPVLAEARQARRLR